MIAASAVLVPLVTNRAGLESAVTTRTAETTRRQGTEATVETSDPNRRRAADRPETAADSTDHAD